MCAMPSNTTDIFHADLGVTRTVPTRQVAIWQRSGWIPVESLDLIDVSTFSDPEPVYVTAYGADPLADDEPVADDTAD